DLEFPLNDVARILSDCDEDQDPLEFLESHKGTLQTKLQHYRNLVDKIDHVISQEREARKVAKMSSATFQIEEKTVASHLVAGIRMTGKYSNCSTGFSAVGRKLGRHIAGKPLMICHDGEYKEDNADFETCYPIRKSVSIDGLDVRELPAARCVTLVHKGSYDTIHRTYARIMEYCADRKYELQLPTREVYLKGPGMIFRGNPNNYLTEIQIPIAE
ncbi:MAG: GyrI-like domain-containing protein, partial [Planctomycetota bacterium]